MCELGFEFRSFWFQNLSINLNVPLNKKIQNNEKFGDWIVFVSIMCFFPLYIQKLFLNDHIETKIFVK